MDPSKDDIRFVETPPTDALMPTPITWETWVIAGCILLLVALLAFLIWRLHRKAKAVSPQDLLKKAHDEAIAAFASCPSEERTPTATECSLILRRYLAAVTKDPALFETHDEWVARHDSIDSFSEALKEQIAHLFGKLAEWKYAPSDHGDEPAAIIDQSRQLLETINQEVTA